MCNTNDWIFKIYLHGEQIDETFLEGVAQLKFESAKMLGLAELHKVYVGVNFDPVLHFTIIHKGGIIPPCDSNSKKCHYRKSVSIDFHSTSRKTSVRAEVMCPSDRCGYMLKPSKIGGSFFDYAECLR